MFSVAFVRTWRRASKRLVAAGAVGVAGLAGYLVVSVNAHAATTFTLSPTSVAGDLEIGSSTYATVRDAVNNAISGNGALTLPVPIPDLQTLSVSGVSAASDDGKNSLAINGTVTLQGQGVNLQLSAVWPDASSTSPQIAVAVKPAASSLSALNALWSGAPVNPTLTSALVVASPSSAYSFDPAALPAAAQSFYPSGIGTLPVGHGMALVATVDASSDATLSNALHYLGEGSTVTIRGTASGSIAPLFGGASQAQEKGLDLTISDTAVGSSLPSWITSRDSSVELQIVDDNGTITPSVQLSDSIGVDLNGQMNTYTGTAAYTQSGFGGASVSLTYGLQPNTTLEPPFDLGALTLASPRLTLSMTTGGTPSFSGEFDVDATVGAKTFHVAAALTAGSGGAVQASLALTGSVSSGDLVAFANQLLFAGSTSSYVDASSLGDAVTFTGVTFSFSKDSSSQQFGVSASATIRSTLEADVALTVAHATGSPTKLLVGLHVADPTCSCVKVANLFSGQLSSLASGLQFPAVDVLAEVGYGSAPTSVSTSSLPSQITALLHKVYSSLPSTITLQPGLSFAGNVTLPDAVTSAFGMSAGAQVLLSGDVGVDLGAFAGSGAPALSGSITAALPTMTATLPSWLGSTASVDWTVSLSADSNKTVQLDVQADSTIDVTIEGSTYPVTLSGEISTGTGGTVLSLDGKVTGTFTDLFGISWLSLTDPHVQLNYDTSKSPASFSASLDGTVTIGGKSAAVSASITKGDGTDASVEVTLLDSVSLNDVLTSIGANLSSLNLPTLTISALDAKFAAGSSGASFDMSAQTTLTTHSNTTVDSTLLVSVSKSSSGTQLLAGFSATSNAKLSDFVSSVPSGVDFSFPHFAVVLAHPAITLTPAKMTPNQLTFFNTFCGDSNSPCHDSLQLADGLSVVADVQIPTQLDGLLNQVHESSTVPLLVTGVLPVFGGDLSSFSLTVDLPQIPITDSTPDLFQSGGLSLKLTATSIELKGTVTFNITKGSSVTTHAQCDALSGVWRTERGTSTQGCFDQVPFDLDAAISLNPVPSVTLTGGLDQGYQWIAPMGQSWLTLNDATVQFGISMTVPGPTFTLGVDIGFTISGHDFFGAFLASATPIEAPPFIAVNVEGIRVNSNSGLSMQDLVDVANAVTGQSFTLGGVPNIAVRKIDLSFSEVNDPQLCLPQGIHVAADLYINPSTGVTDTVGGGCPTDPSSETSRAQQCQSDAGNGCFAAADFSIDDNGIRASGLLGAFDVGPIDFGGAQLDLEVSPTVQRLLLKGSMSITGFASGSIDLLVSSSDLHFRGSVQVLGSAFDAYLDGDASFSLTDLASLKNPPSFSVNAVLKSDFLNQAGVAISGPLQALKPAIQAMDVILGDVANGDLLDAVIDLPTQVASMGATLPGSLGSTLGDISSELSTVKSDIDSFGHTFTYGINDILNGFELSFPGLPGTYVPSSPTCVTTWQDGTCYSIPPTCWGALGCTGGVPGYVANPTCITDEVNGTCYSVPPFDWGHVPGLCDSIKSLIPQIYNSSTGQCDVNQLVPNLINPVLKAAFKTVTGYDMGNQSLTTVLDDIAAQLGSGNVFAINCAQFSASLSTGGTPSAQVSLATDLSLFGTDENFGLGWNFSPNTSNAGQAVLDILQSIINPSTNVSCGLPSDWNSNANFPDALGTGPTSSGPVNPSPTPTMSLSLASSTIDEGSAATVNGTITPAPSAGTAVSLSWGDGSAAVTVTTAGDGSFTASRTFTNNLPPGHPAAQYAVTASRSGGPHASAMLTVANVAPSNVSLSATPGTVGEGSPTTLNGSFTDPGADTHTVLITWGDGSSDTLSLAAGVTSFAKAHTYLDNNGSNAGYAVHATVTDDDLAHGYGNTTIGVSNVAPHGITVTPLSCVVATGAVPCASLTDAQENALVTYRVAFTDPGVLDTETAVITWGDGSSDTVNAGTNRSFVTSHQWTEADVNPHSTGEDPTHGIFPIGVTVTDKDGGVGTGSSSETVENAAPAGLTETLSKTTIAEDDPPVSVYGVFTDASGSDTHTVTVDWGTGWGGDRYQTIHLGTGVFSYIASRQYGDNGTYPIAVTVTDDDGASVSTSQTLTVLNLPPSIAIDRSTTVQVKGIATFLGHAGAPLTFSAHIHDPGSDDETGVWNWGDRTANTSTTYLNNPPNPDPALSPQVNPRDLTDTHPHTWQNACLYNMTATATDDDGGAASDTSHVVITNNTSKDWGAGYWASQYALGGAQKIPTATLTCYLTMTRYLSSVLGAPVTLNTAADAARVLSPSSSDAHAKLARELLVGWLNFDNGAFDWNTMVDTNWDGIPDTPFHQLMTQTEAIYLNPSSTDAQVLAIRNVLANLFGD